MKWDNAFEKIRGSNKPDFLLIPPILFKEYKLMNASDKDIITIFAEKIACIDFDAENADELLEKTLEELMLVARTPQGDK